MSKCTRCDNDATPIGNATFMRNEISFSVSKQSWTCDECAVQELIEILDDYPELIKKKNDEVEVDWELFVKTSHERRGEERIWDMKKILLCAGIFSYSAEGNWTIIKDSKMIAPTCPSGDGSMYFTRQEDVLKYAEFELKDIRNWQIHHIDVTVYKDEAINAT